MESGAEKIKRFFHYLPKFKIQKVEALL